MRIFSRAFAPINSVNIIGHYVCFAALLQSIKTKSLRCKMTNMSKIITH